MSTAGAITYEVLERGARSGLQWAALAQGYGVPRIGPWWSPIASPRGIRSVDEAGNRSEIVQLTVWHRIENC